MIKTINTLCFLLISSAHITFLALIIKESTNSFIIFLMSLFIIVLAFVYFKLFKKIKKEIFKPYKLHIIIFTITGAILTYLININLGLGPVIGAGIIGTIASFIPTIFKKTTILKELPIACYCGSFIGMSSPVVTDIKTIIFGGLITGIILIFSQNSFQGFGGKLGTLAFLGVTLSSLIISIF